MYKSSTNFSHNCLCQSFLFCLGLIIEASSRLIMAMTASEIPISLHWGWFFSNKLELAGVFVEAIKAGVKAIRVGDEVSVSCAETGCGIAVQVFDRLSMGSGDCWRGCGDAAKNQGGVDAELMSLGSTSEIYSIQRIVCKEFWYPYGVVYKSRVSLWNIRLGCQSLSK